MTGTSHAVVTSVADAATTQTLAAARTGQSGFRKGVHIYNTSSAVLYVKLGAGASSTDFTHKIAADAAWTLPYDGSPYQGIVTGIWGSDSTGAALVTEFL